MVTYLVGTDGQSASEAICEYLEPRVREGDHVEAVNVLTSRKTTGGAEERLAGEAALELVTERLGDLTTVSTRQFHRGRTPTDELLYHAEEVDADEFVVALRRHSRTERVIVGSVSHALVRRTTLPITLVPLREYLPPTE